MAELLSSQAVGDMELWPLTPGAIRRIFVAKRRQPHKRHAMIGNYDLH
jgi:hypothetical protein